MKRLRRICALFVSIVICATMVLTMPVGKVVAESENKVNESALSNGEYWKIFLQENPEKAERYKFTGGFARYIYDRRRDMMTKSPGESIEDPFDYSVYDENGDLVNSYKVWGVIPEPPALYFDAIPMDYLYLNWFISGDRDKGERRVEAWHLDDYRKQYAGDDFDSTYSDTKPIRAAGSYGSDLEYDVHFGQKYNFVQFLLEYYYDIRIVSKDFWPIEYIEKTGVVPENVRYTLQEAMDDRESHREPTPVYNYDDTILGYETREYSETTLAGKRTFIKDVQSNIDVVVPTEHYHSVYNVEKDSYNSFDTYVDVKKENNSSVKEYYIIEELKELPGYYACIYIKIHDEYWQEYRADGSGDVDPHAIEIINEYNRLRPIVTEQLLNELAALKPCISFSANGGVIHQDETVHASDHRGEDEGSGLFSEIIEGNPLGDISAKDLAGAIAGGLIAVGIVGIIISNGEPEGKEEKKKKKYKMYVQKDFGDAIRKGDQPVIVRARIAEIDEKGKERDRNDLTGKIKATCLGLSLQGSAVNGRYFEATVSAPRDLEEKEGSVTFHFSGEGGSFSKKVIFRIVGTPKIVFPALSEDGNYWLMNTDVSKVAMVAGLGGQESLRFLIQDAAEEPKGITFQNSDGFQIVPVKDTELAFTYYAQITNRTEKMAKVGNIFFRTEEREITINAELSDGIVIHETFTIELYPDGLSVESINPKLVVEERLLIDTEPDPNPGPGYATIKPVGFKVMVCFVNAEGKAIILSNPTLHFEKLEDEGKYLETFKGQFKYKISRAGSVGFDFMPESTLPTIIDPYEVTMRIRFEREADQSYPCEGMLPIRFFGFKPLPPSQAEHAAAVKRLKDTIKKYGLSGGDPFLTRMIQNSDFYSASEIEFTRYQVILAAKLYYESEAREYMAIANVFDRYVVVAGGMVTAGDYAIEVILSRCLSKKVGTLAAKFINPLKNMLATAIGEYFANGKEFTEEEFWKAYRSGIYDMIEQMLSDVKPSAETAGKVAAGYMMLMFVKHYVDGEGKEKGDVYRSVIAAFYDLKLNQLKKWFGDLVSKGSAVIWGKVQNWFGEAFRRQFIKSIKKALDSTKTRDFIKQVREAYEKDGTLTNAQYKFIQDTQPINRALQYEQLKRVMPGFVKESADKGVEILQLTLGQVVNYFIGGKEEGGKGLAAKPEDVLMEWIFDKVAERGKKAIESIEEYLENAMPAVYISDGIMTVACFGETYEVSLEEKAQEIMDRLYEYCFSWMDDIWEEKMPPMESLPDKRDEMSEDTSLLDRQQARLDHAEKPL